MIVKEVQAKSILSPSQVYDYVVNAYTGCQHGCSYCYARFMKRFTGHREPWGQFVDIKLNAPDLLRREILKKKTEAYFLPPEEVKQWEKATKVVIDNYVKKGGPLVKEAVDELYRLKQAKK